jgi:hypothetical protein
MWRRKAVERSGSRLRRCGGKGVGERSGTSMRRWRRRDREKWHQDSQMWRRKRVEKSGTRMRRYEGGKEIVGRSGNRMRRWRRYSREK